MSRILPAVIPKNFRDLESKVETVVGMAKVLHLDVTNGTITETSSWPYIDGQIDKTFEAIINEEKTLPLWEELNYESHLMVKNPKLIIGDWVEAGVERIIVHVESFNSTEELSIFIDEFYDNHGSLFYSLELGLAINLATPLERLKPHIKDVDFIHLLSIDEIGSQGNPFNQKIFDRIKELKLEYPEAVLAVDGGINEENADDLLALGVDRLVIGSAIFNSPDPRETLEDLLQLTK